MPQYDLRIETERLIIRPFELSDIAPSYEMNLDPEVSRYTGDGGIVSYEELQRRIEEDVMGDYQKHGYGRLAVELKGVDKFIGFTGLKFIPELGTTDLGYRFKSAYWGKGIATESAIACVKLGFEQLKLDHLLAFVLPDNIGSVRVLEKLNFCFEGEYIEEGILAHQYRLNKPS